MMKAEGLSGGYGDSRLINNVSLTVEKGEFLGILGPNGSGKTTLLHLLTGTLPAKKGRVYLAGKLLADYKPKELAQIMLSCRKNGSSLHLYCRRNCSLWQISIPNGAVQTAD